MVKEVARGPCALIAGKKRRTSPSTLRFVQALESISIWINITLEVEGDAERFAGELLNERYRKALDKLGLSLTNALASAWKGG